MVRLPVFGTLTSGLLSVIVRDLDIVRITIDEPEANTPLVVDRNRVLPTSITLQSVKPVSGKDPQVIDARRQVDVLELPNRPPHDVRRESPRPPRLVDRASVPVRERLDHDVV
jgi:hypothetical protein